MASYIVNPQWQDDLDRRATQLTGAVMSMQNAATQSALAASRQQNETLSRMNHPNAGVPSRSVSADGSRGDRSERDVNTPLGTAHICDAIGRCTIVSNTSDNFFMDHSGKVLAGPSSGGPPDSSGGWSRRYRVLSAVTALRAVRAGAFGRDGAALQSRPHIRICMTPDS